MESEHIDSVFTKLTTGLYTDKGVTVDHFSNLLRSVTMKIKYSKTISAIVTAGSIMISSAPANAESCYAYSVNIQGVATVGDANFTSGSRQFNINQWVILRASGYRNNPVEFSLATFTDLNASAQIGQIELSTNSAFAKNRGIASQQFDLATVTQSRNNVSALFQFEIDSGASFILPPPNVFVSPGQGTVPGGLGGLGFLPGAGGQLGQLINNTQILSTNFFYPRNGGGYFYSPDGTWSRIAGQISLVGSGTDNASHQGRYQGRFRGDFRSAYEC
jgi:hypothetical protein